MDEKHFDLPPKDRWHMPRPLQSLLNRFIPAHLHQVIVFLFVGGCVTLGYILLATLIAYSSAWRPAIVSIVSWILMIPIGYTAQRVFVFGQTANHRTALPRYVITQIIGLSISSGLSEILLGWIRLTPFIGFFIVGLTTAIFSFILLKFWTFTTSK